MKQLVIIIIVFISSILGYVVYAISQQANEPKTAGEVLAEIINPPVEDEPETVGPQAPRLKQFARSTNPDFEVDRSDPDMLRLQTLATPQAPIQLSISPATLQNDNQNGQVEITFTNVSEKAIKIIKPLDGSYYGWYQPHYKFTVIDSKDQELPLGGRCGVSGLWGDTSFPENYLIELPPQESHKLQAYLPFAFSNSGEYRVTFEYIYDYSKNEAKPPKNAGDTAWTQPLEGVWQGTARSNTVVLEIEKE